MGYLCEARRPRTSGGSEIGYIKTRICNVLVNSHVCFGLFKFAALGIFGAAHENALAESSYSETSGTHA